MVVVEIFNERIWKELLETAIGVGKVVIEVFDIDEGRPVVTWEFGAAYLKDDSVIIDGGIYFPNRETAEEYLKEYVEEFPFVEAGDRIRISWY